MSGFVDSMRLKADQAALEADKLIRIRREQRAIDQLRRDIKAQLDALSQAALTAYRAGEIAHPQLVSICQQIDALNEQIGQREARIEQIRAEKLATPPVIQAGVPCPSCKQLIPDGAAFCPVCGYKIPKAPPAEATCPSCGSPIPAAAQFCPSCGARKAPAPQTIRCAGCGAELPATAIFCPDCGARVGAAAPYAPPSPPATPTPVPVAAAPAVVAPVVPEEPVVSEEVEVTPGPEPEVALPFDEPAEVVAPVTPEAALPSDEPAEVVAPVASEVASEPRTKLCSSCQAELPIEAIFCPDCGARQQAP
ncbi:MAG: hypothetical protein CVU38_04610 [Chloroflexi bacterium HGW-Chloroflexi-1]|nr:MAG: hypothetical protein CVU38_04610 [Chloroflexi bacterium HGW-Chloroflexi-1]